ncbi:MAG: hypothetical protein V4706_04615 [Pseudomonadota bacterium]
MIYISVDNDHHTDLALSLIKQQAWTRDEVLFISHRGARNRRVAMSGFRFEEVDVHPLCSGLSFKNPQNYWKSLRHQARLKRHFKFHSTDILVVTTEYEINNAFFAEQMRQSGGKIYIYDEGIGFYFNNSPYPKQNVSIAGAFFLLLYNLAFRVLRIPAYAQKGFEARMHVRIREEYIDSIYSRMKLPIDRTVKVIGYRSFLASESANQPKFAEKAIFFANNLDAFGLKTEELELSEKALRQMSVAFKDVYLKVHPADWVAKNDICNFYIGLARELPNIRLVDNTMSGHEALESIRPSIVVGTIGAAMFDALLFGCHAIFLFHLLPEVEEFGVCSFTLSGLGYKYIEDVVEIEPGYRSGVDRASLLYDAEQANFQGRSAEKSKCVASVE